MSLFALSAITAAIRKVNQSAEGDPYWDKVVSLLHFDGQDGSTDIQDVRDNTWSAVGATLDTSRKQFGSSSCHLETTTSYVEASSSNFAFGTGDFTIEGMHHADSQTRNEGTLLDNRFGSYGSDCVLYRSVTWDRLYFYTNGANRFYEVIPRTEWFHWALVRKNGVIRLYINGVSNNSYTYTGTYDQNTWRLGNNLTGNDGCMGYLDEVRITKGVARYTGTFTPPTKAFPNNQAVTAPNSGLVHFYTMDNITGGNVEDEIGTADLVLNGLTQDIGWFGQALSFDGIDDFAELQSSVFNGDTFAYTGIAKVTQQTGNFFLLCHRDDNQALIQLSVQDNQIVLQVRSSTSSIASGSAPNDGEFFFFVFNFDKNGDCELFVNNTLAISFATPAGDYVSQDSIIGPYSRDGVERIFDSAAPGYVDQLRIYNRVLSVDDVDRLYREGQTWSVSDLFKNGKLGAWYDPSDLSTLFQDVAGTVPVQADGDPVALMLDKSGLDDHMTQTSSTRRPIYRTDGVKHWLEFDGANEYMESSDASWINTATELLVAVAVNIVGNGGDDYGGVISKGMPSSNNYRGFNIRESAAYGVQFIGLGADQSAGFSTVRDQPLVASGVWVSGSTMSIYRDGNIESQITPSANDPSAPGYMLTLGKLSYGSFFKRMNFHGAILIRDSVMDQRPKVDDYLATKI